MIRLISCGYNFIHRDGIVIDRPNGAGNYAFVFFKTQSEIALDGRSFSVEKNTYILFHPANRHMYADLEKPFVNDWFHCDGDDLPEFLSRLKLPLDTPVKAADPYMISRCIMGLHDTVQQGGPLKEQIVDLELRTLFMKLSNIRDLTAQFEKISRYFPEFSQLRNQLYSSPGISFSVRGMASSINLSKSYFQHIYKELFGCTAMSDIINGRLEYAKYLLDNSSMSVAIISKMCGYENETHFMRQFKKFVGITPSQYKSRHLHF